MISVGYCILAIGDHVVLRDDLLFQRFNLLSVVRDLCLELTQFVNEFFLLSVHHFLSPRLLLLPCLLHRGIHLCLPFLYQSLLFDFELGLECVF